MQYAGTYRGEESIQKGGGWGDDVSKDFQEEVTYYVLGKLKDE